MEEVPVWADLPLCTQYECFGHSLTLYLHFWALYKGNTVQYHLYLHCYASRSKYITKAINEITKIDSSLSLVFITYEGGFPFLSLKEKIGQKLMQSVQLYLPYGCIKDQNT